MKTHFIYGLICPIKNEIVYVGRTENLDRRVNEHRGHAKCKTLNKWYSELSKIGKRKDIKAVILEDSIADSWDAAKREKLWIATLSENHSLLNVKYIEDKKKPVIHVTATEYEVVYGKSLKSPKLKAA